MDNTGKDSVAFILYDKNKYPAFGLVKQHKALVDETLVTAFEVMLTNELEIPQIVHQEVFKTSGYNVQLHQIKFLGERFVSSQVNEFCYLYVVDVTDLTHGPTNTLDLFGKSQEVVWVDKYDIQIGIDWRSQVIIERLETYWKLDIATKQPSSVNVLKDAHTNLIKIRDALVKMNLAADYFNKNATYLRDLHHGKTDEQIITEISRSIKK